MKFYLTRVATTILLSSAIAGGAWANIELPPLLQDGAVLQRDEPIPIWGMAPVNSEVTVVLAGQEKRVISDAQGNWRTSFPARKASDTPLQMRVTSGELTRTLNDLIVGDVWVCSGQSNMEWVVRESGGAEDEITSVNAPQIRHFKIPRSWSSEPSDILAGGDWRSATAENVADFTAIGWYFAKHIHASTNVPIGLINATWGGSRIEAWMSPRALGTSPETAQNSIDQLVAAGNAKAADVRQRLRRWPGALVMEIDGPVADWSAGSLDEQDWLTIRAPGLWEEQGYPGVDGFMWYRKTFELSAEEVKHGVILGLGRIDDNDITWVNGRKVGETNAYDQIRVYKVPAQFLRPGKNQIAIRIEDNQVGGGIYSSDDLLYVETENGKRRSLAGEWKIKADKVTVSVSDNFHHTDTALYNKMVYPLFHIPVKGVLWYQGESNANTAKEAENYRRQFPALIEDWRKSWRNQNLPFYWVQLANFNSGVDTPTASPWAILRESQTATLSLKHTGQAITIDIGDPADIHPRDKKSVGERLARIALNKTYEKRKVHFRGPAFQSIKTNNNQIIIKFKTARSLHVEDPGGAVKGFEIADSPGHFKPVIGSIKENTVILPLSASEKPAAVRYAWSDNPEDANLQDDAGLPAEPFRKSF